MERILHKLHKRAKFTKSSPPPPSHYDSEPLDFLSSAHLHESNGFYLKSKDESPTSLEIKPTHDMGQVSVAISRWKMETSSLSSPSTSSLSSWTRQPISVAVVKTGMPVAEDEVMELRHRSRPSSLVGGGVRGSVLKGSRIVDVYFPHRSDELLGWIKYHVDDHPSRNDFDEGWLITDVISKSTFLTSPLELATEDLKMTSSQEVGLGMRISTVDDLTVAVLQTKRGMRQRRTGQVNWTDWKVQFTPEFSTSLPTSAKAVILAASIVWVLSSKEKEGFARRALSRRQNSAD